MPVKSGIIALISPVSLNGAMRTVNLHEAKTHLSCLVERAAKGEPFIIAKAGKPLVRVVALDAPAAAEQKRLGFMPGIDIPDDFDTMAAREIEDLFYRGDGGK